jgi:hypothetical protein
MPEKIPVTIMLDPDQVRMIETIMPAGRTVADSIEELIIDPIHRAHFLHAAAPRDYYAVRKAVSGEEIAAFRASAAGA